MIVAEHRLDEIFKTFPEIPLSDTNTSRKVSFSWGNKDDLDKYLKASDSNCYPLIWLLPSEEIENRRNKTVTRKCIFIISVLEPNVELFNGERYIKSFDYTLNPLAEYIKESLDLSSTTRLIDPTRISQFKHPNYSERENKGTIDLWDAIRLEIDVEFNNECFKPISWVE